MKKTITLEAIDPIEIYGAGNRILEEFCSYFPGLKVIARGNQLILDGKPDQIDEFNIRLGELIERRHQKMNLTTYDVEDIFDGETSSEKFKMNGDAVIVHSTDGKPIKARNKTQQDMVKAYFENDLLFAVGPAGTGKTYVAIALAVRALKNREIKRIILTRPAVEAGERLGFLPGDLISPASVRRSRRHDPRKEASGLHRRRHDTDRTARIHAWPHSGQSVRNP